MAHCLSSTLGSSMQGDLEPKPSPILQLEMHENVNNSKKLVGMPLEAQPY
jgi:hypothetical protein